MTPDERHSALQKLFIDYVEGELEADMHRELTAHLEECPECDAFMESYQATIRLVRTAATDVAADMPGELKKRLSDFLDEHLLRGEKEGQDS